MWILGNQLVTEHVSVDTSDQQIFLWIRICYIREQNWVQISRRQKAGRGQ
jgi:hypothetical protein